ncbi:MAG: COX15/CtaA family protein [Actinobacteria bacterium]|nr:COX15/CtaA family protein [Actinomycetota bacterium]
MSEFARKWLVAILRILLIFQVGIVLTGGVVRLTGSGLGCPTWPECVEGSYTPVEQQLEGFRAWIEFGNRLLTFALVIACALSILAVLLSKRKDLRLLVLGQFAGIFGQAVLGGITVLTNLHPLPVAGHFVLSIILIAGAQSLLTKAKAAYVRKELSRSTLHALARTHVSLTFVVIVMGTFVTGSGPHAGDPGAPRFNFDFRTVAWLHADLVIALLGFSLAYVIYASTPLTTKRLLKFFFLTALLQGAIGYVQYFLDLPEFIVAMHMLGSTLVWISAWKVWISVSRQTKERELI